jgi:phage protein D
MVLSVTYVDYLSGLSGEVEVVIEDHDQRWQGAWYPALGDQLNLAIGYHDEGLLPCGDFQVDELELAGPPDRFTMRCLAAYITPSMRTPNSAGYENQTLLSIAQTVAEKYGMSVVSAADFTDLSFARVTQKHETDLAFLKRLALEHGYDFTVRGSLLIFYATAALEAIPPVQSITRSDLESFEFRNRTHRIYRSADVTYQDPTTKSLIARNATAMESIPTGDALKLSPRCENGQQALLKAQAALDAQNRFFTEGVMVMPGSTAMASGNNLAFSGFGEFDGIYMTTTAKHKVNRAHGYTTQLEVRRVF